MLHAGRLITTTAKSSVSSPSAQSRHAASAASAISRGGSERRSDKRASSRSTPVLLAAAARLDDAVRVSDDDRARRELGRHCLVRLRRVDPKCEAAREDPLDGAVGLHQPRGRMAAACARDLALRGVDHELDHRDEPARRDLGSDDLVRGGKKLPRVDVLASERAEDVFRHRHVRGRVDPVAGDISKDDGKAAVPEREVVVDVAADLDAGSGLVDVAELESR